MIAEDEIQLEATNYKKNGQPFTNILSVIPLQLAPSGHKYIVEFNFELE